MDMGRALCRNTTAPRQRFALDSFFFLFLVRGVEFPVYHPGRNGPVSRGRGSIRRHPHHRVGNAVGLDLGGIAGVGNFQIAALCLAVRASAAAGAGSFAVNEIASEYGIDDDRPRRAARKTIKIHNF